MSPRKSLWPVATIFGLLGGLHFALYKLYSISFHISKDQSTYTYPLLCAIKQALNRGEWPLWTVGEFFGEPLWFMGSYDIKAISLLFFLEPLDCMVALASLHMFLGGIAFFWMVRKLFDYSFLATLFGSLIWVFNGFLIWYYYDGPYGPICLWTPVIILALTQWTRRPLLWIALLTLALFDQLQTGRFESVELSWAAAFVFCLLHHGFVSHSQPKVFIKTFGLWILGFAVATVACFALGAPLFWDQFYAIFRSNRYNTVVEPALYPTAWINFFNLVPNSEFFFKFSSGIDHRSYIGFAGLLLIIVALFFSQNRKRVLVFLLGAVVINLFLFDTQFGKFNLFINLYKALPGHGGIRYSIRFLPYVFLMLSIVMMEGVDALRVMISSGCTFLLRGLSALFLLPPLTLLIILKIHSPVVWQVTDRGTLLFWLLAANVGVLGWIVIAPKWVRVTTVLQCALYLASIYLVNTMMAGGSSLGEFRNIHEDPKLKPALRFFEKMPPHQARVVAIPRGEDGLTAMARGIGLETVGGYYMMLSKEKINYFQTVMHAHIYGEYHASDQLNFLEGYSLANVRYFLVEHKPERRDPLDPNNLLTPVFIDPKLSLAIFENRNAFPRAYLVRNFEVVPNAQAPNILQERIHSNPKWFRHHVLLHGTSEETLRSLRFGTRLGGDSSVQIRHHGAESIDLTVTSATGAILVISDTLDKGRWRVLVNDEPRELLQANSIFAGVFVPPGTHGIHFEYFIPIWRLMSTLITTVILVGCLATTLLRYQDRTLRVANLSPSPV